MQPRLYSVIISGYKDTARQTLEGVLALQDADDVSFEVIFLDNTGDSRHKSMVQELFATAGTEHIRKVYLPHPLPGKAAAQNRGIAQAGGAYYIFLDDDVLPAKTLVLAYDRGFGTHACGAIQGCVALAFEPGACVPAWLNARFRLDLAEMDFGSVIMPFEMGLTGANMAFHAGVFQRFGVFDERLGPGRSGTLEDQEFSERIRAGGEVQLFWPEARVQHRIPPARLRLRGFLRIYYDVGYSDFFLSGHHIVGGRVRFTLYTLKQLLILAARLCRSALAGRRPDMLHALCEMARAYGYWRQGLVQLGKR